MYFARTRAGKRARKRYAEHSAAVSDDPVRNFLIAFFRFCARRNRTKYTYDAANQLTGWNTEAPGSYECFVYDERGNCTCIVKPGYNNCTYFEYNDANLVKSIKFMEDVDVTMNYFYYDAMMRRYAMQDSGGLSYFTWDGNGLNPLAERNTSGAVVSKYAHGYSPVDGIGSMIAAERATGGGTYYQFDIHDHRGSVIRRVNQNGAIVGYFEYNAWGIPLRSETGGTSSRFAYQTNWIKLEDALDDLYLSVNRPYSAHLGRMLNRNPWGVIQGRYNLYDAMMSNPVKVVEPLSVGEAADGSDKAAETSGTETMSREIERLQKSLEGLRGNENAAKKEKPSLKGLFQSWWDDDREEKIRLVDLLYTWIGPSLTEALPEQTILQAVDAAFVKKLVNDTPSTLLAALESREAFAKAAEGLPLGALGSAGSALAQRTLWEDRSAEERLAMIGIGALSAYPLFLAYREALKTQGWLPTKKSFEKKFGQKIGDCFELYSQVGIDLEMTRVGDEYEDYPDYQLYLKELGVNYKSGRLSASLSASYDKDSAPGVRGSLFDSGRFYGTFLPERAGLGATIYLGHSDESGLFLKSGANVPLQAMYESGDTDYLSRSTFGLALGLKITKVELPNWDWLQKVLPRQFSIVPTVGGQYTPDPIKDDDRRFKPSAGIGLEFLF